MHQSIPAAPRSPHPPHQGKINGIHVFKSNYTCLIVYQCINQFQLRPGPPSHPIRVKSMAYNYVFKSNYTCLIVYQCISQFQLCPAPTPPPQQGKLNDIHVLWWVKLLHQAFANPGAIPTIPKLLMGEAGIDWCRILFICLCDNYFILCYLILGWCWCCCKGSQGGL